MLYHYPGVQSLSSTVFILSFYFINTLNYLASISPDWRPKSRRLLFYQKTVMFELKYEEVM